MNADKDPRFRINCSKLNHGDERIYTNSEDINSDHAIQCTNIPRGKSPSKKIAEYFDMKNLFFYIRAYDFLEENKQDLIIEFSQNVCSR